jgi:hypothetical protein
MGGPRFNAMIAEKRHDLIGQIGDRIGGRERAGFESRFWTCHGCDLGLVMPPIPPAPVLGPGRF